MYPHLISIFNVNLSFRPFVMAEEKPIPFKSTQEDSTSNTSNPDLSLGQLMEKKSELNRTLADLEREIYAAEGEIF